MKFYLILITKLFFVLSYAHELENQVRDSTDIPLAAKIGIDSLSFWRDIQLKYPGTGTEIPELTDEAARITAGAKEQILKYYPTDKAATLIQRIIYVYDTYKIHPYTLSKFYEFIGKLCSAASPSFESYSSETFSFCQQLLDSGYIVAPVYPTAGSEEFDGKIGYVAIVTGLTQKIWLAGLTFRPDAHVSNYYIEDKQYLYRSTPSPTPITPSLFWWYEVAADALIFMIQRKLFDEQHSLDSLSNLLSKKPTAEIFQKCFALFRRNNIGDTISIGD